MKKEDFIKELSDIDGVISLCQFGSYETEYWIKDRSDIDLAVVMKPETTFMYTIKIEDTLESLCRKYYKYDKIHLTFILFNEFSTKYARMAIDSEKKYIVDENDWYDFQHYVLKHIRNNENLEKRLKIDEQYSYFGGIIDESVL
ncbi:nucleotidyltransferase domain-containing protein [Clostridium sp.]|uniref:nucleotidyltransferase domain-containing protein n=1 Tax=Clostridium sp. TaxID=1506 RepID=UPI003F31CE72